MVSQALNPSTHKAETGGAGKLKTILAYTVSSGPAWEKPNQNQEQAQLFLETTQKAA